MVFFLEMRYDSLGVELVCLAHGNFLGSIYLPLWLFLLLFIWVLFQRRPNLIRFVDVTAVALSKYRRILVSTCAVVGYVRTAGVRWTLCRSSGTPWVAAKRFSSGEGDKYIRRMSY